MKTKLLVAAGALLVSFSATAIVVDLTTTGASGSANGGFFQQVGPQPTGTGYIDPFLRVRANGDESGFNNNVDKFTLDNVAKGGQTWCHDILLGTVPKVTIAGVQYYQFLLDINEPNGGNTATLSLHELEIWLKASPISTLAGPQGAYSDLTGSGAAKMWDLDSGADGNSVVELNYDLNSGSGSGDMFAYIPVSALGTDGTKNVYLYSAFGNPNASEDGFEEWATIQQITTVPDGGTTLILLGMGMAGLAGLRRKLSV